MMKSRTPRENDAELGKLTRLQIDLYASPVLLDNDVVTDRQAKAGALSRGLGRKEGIEHLFLHLGRDADAIVTNPDLHTVTEACRCGR